MANRKIREAAKAAGVHLWEIASCMGIADTTLSKKLRRELSPEEREQILTIIKSIAKRSDSNEQ